MSAGKIHPLDELSLSQVSCLLEEYRSLVDYLYPIVDVAHLTQLAKTIFLSGSEKSSNTSYEPYAVIDNIEVAILKVLLTIVLPDQNKLKSDLASRLHQSVRDEVGHMVWNSDVDLNGIALLLLVVRINSRAQIPTHSLTDMLEILEPESSIQRTMASSPPVGRQCYPHCSGTRSESMHCHQKIESETTRSETNCKLRLDCIRP